MKQLLTLLFGLLFAANVSEAQEVTPTDIDALDNALYVEPVTAAPGKQTVLSVRMKNNFPVAGFEFVLRLPEGITVATEDDFLKVELSTERTTTQKTNYFDYFSQGENSLKVLSGTTAGNPETGLYTFSGNDGEVARITIEVPADYEKGDYAVSIAGGVMSNEEQTIEVGSDVTSVLTVGDVVIVLDENSTEVPEASDGDVDILVKRTIKGGQWSTICLPFDMTEEQVYEAFGDDVQLQEFIDYETEKDEVSGNITKITVNFDDADLSEGFLGNYPYLIKTSSDITEFSVTATIAPDEENAVAEYAEGRGARRHVYGTLYGTFHAQTEVPENCLFLSGNQFWYSVGLTKMKAFRAYFELEDMLPFDEAGAANITMEFNKPTGIKSMTVDKSQSGDYYTIDGQKLNGKPSKKGVYVTEGKKVVVK